MKRKLIKLAQSTYVVSLPSKWIQNNNLEKGCEINLELIENKIEISIESSYIEKTTELDISDFREKLVWLSMMGAYISGYDYIKVKIKGIEQRNLIVKVVGYLLGMIIYEENSNYIFIKDITNNAKEDIDKILSRIFVLNIGLLEDCRNESRLNNWHFFSNLKERDYMINLYIDYALRQINKFGYNKFEKASLINTYLKLHEILSDKITELFIKLGKNKVKINEDFIEDMIKIYKLLHKLHDSYNNKNLIEFDKKRLTLEKYLIDQNNLVKFNLHEIINLLFDLEELEVQLNS